MKRTELVAGMCEKRRETGRQREGEEKETVVE